MLRALDLARKGWGRTSPNPMVGALIVRDQTVVGDGAHEGYGAAHAEVVALREAGERARGATLYVTLEPCAHHGKTPPCVDAIRAAGIARVVAAVHEPNPVAARGGDRLREAGIDVTFGVCESEARELNAPFFHAHDPARPRRPWTTLKLAISLDAAMADCNRSPGWITGQPARAEAHRLRAGSDAVGVGMGTVLADDPLLTVREAPAPRRPPLRVIFSRHGRLPLSSRLAQTAGEGPVLLLTASIDAAHERTLRALGVDVAIAASLAESLAALDARGVQSLLVEGGAAIAGVLLAEQLADRLVLVQAPIVLGRGSLRAFDGVPGTSLAEARRLRVIRRTIMEGDLLTEFVLREL